VVGLILFVIGDVIYTWLDAADAYYSGHPIDVTWPLFFGCVAIAAMSTYNLYVEGDQDTPLFE